MYFEQLNFERSFAGLDLGEDKNHLMVKAFGLKKDNKAKCKNCCYHQKGTCSFLTEGFIDKEYAACSRHQSKNN